MEKRIIARWESPKGKYFCEVFKDEYGYGYKGTGCGGYIGNLPDDKTALEKLSVSIRCAFPDGAKRIKKVI